MLLDGRIPEEAEFLNIDAVYRVLKLYHEERIVTRLHKGRLVATINKSAGFHA